MRDPWPPQLTVEVGAALVRVARTWRVEHRPERMRWSWGEGVLGLGLLAAGRASGDPDCARFVRAWLGHHQARGVTMAWSDHVTPAWPALELVLAGDDGLRPIVDRAAAYLAAAPRTAGGLVDHFGARRGSPLVRIAAQLVPAPFADAWIDSLFHVAPTLCRLAAATGRSSFRDDAAAQAAGFGRALQDPATGLFAHAYRDADDERVPSWERGEPWARGNGWALAALVDVILQLPGGPVRDELADRARRLADAVIAVQDRGGLFHTVLTDPSTYVETAGSALLVYGLGRGARAGLLDERARAAAIRGMGGLLGAVVHVRGGGAHVVGTSVATVPLPGFYRFVPRRRQVTYGVGAWLLAAAEMCAPVAEADSSAC